MTTVFAGDPVMADEANEALKSGTVIARGRRETSSTASGSEQSVLRVDSIPVVSGRLYGIETSALLLDTSVANDIARGILRVDTTGAAATTASTSVTTGQTRLADATIGNTVTLKTTTAATATGSWSVLLSTSRVSGSGNISITGTSGQPIEIIVTDLGVDPGDTGVDL
jgi:hypothetical protein